MQKKHYQERIELDKKNASLFDVFYSKEFNSLKGSFINSISNLNNPPLSSAMDKMMINNNQKENNDLIEIKLEDLKKIKEKIDEVEQSIRNKREEMIYSHKNLKDSLERAQLKQKRIGNDLGISS